MMNRRTWGILAVAAALLVGGCEQTRNILGLGKDAPDEFAVYSRAPLSLPPDYGLKPPAPGSERPQDVLPRDRARQAVTGPRATADRQPPPAGASPGLVALLRDAGALEADPDIRAALSRENTMLVEENTSVADRILFWRKPPDLDVVVDPAKEAKRIQEARALGQPITAGGTPVISRKPKRLFEGLF